jgi:hypothetical protein
MKLASFRAFLNTGVLGSIRPGLPLNAIAEELGPPDSWLVDDKVGPAPHYWTYGHHLELAFVFDPSPFCTWFQIEDAGFMSGDAVPITKRFAMTLDGLSGASRLSDLIRAVDDPARTQVELRSFGYPDPRLHIGEVEIGFDGDGKGFDHDWSLAQKILFYEENASLNSIYSYHRDPTMRAAHEAHLEKVSSDLIGGAAYLTIAGQG